VKTPSNEAHYDSYDKTFGIVDSGRLGLP